MWRPVTKFSNLDHEVISISCSLVWVIYEGKVQQKTSRLPQQSFNKKERLWGYKKLQFDKHDPIQQLLSSLKHGLI